MPSTLTSNTACQSSIEPSVRSVQPGAPPTPALIDAAFLDCQLEELQATAAAISESLENIGAIDQTLTEYVGNSWAPDLQDLIRTLAAMNKFVTEQLSKRGVSMNKTETDPEPSTEIPTANAVGQTTGEILSREAAVQMMEKISRYYTTHEPSSPIPLLMQRAKRLSSMDFMGILGDLAPSALNQLQNIAGSCAGAKEGDSNDGE